MSTVPDNLRYASTHEWVQVDDDGIATIGISDHAQNALGDIVFIELPEAGAMVNSKDEVAVVESVKAASDIYSPVSGEILEVNEALLDAAETINLAPYVGGWFYKLKLIDASELDKLMDADAYVEHCDAE
ncbi:MAG TPA: glycine cleavage system protein GcvH [Gammaproteobacteria bacterium]|nr:glycine cleavage system protein H [Gammaproteobacteria bacterium]HAT27497.1 glycine cleavage system protein GcvH [Gammaproteobacteria bacterium]